MGAIRVVAHRRAGGSRQSCHAVCATADSITAASLHAAAPWDWSEDATIDAKVAECLHVASVFEGADNSTSLTTGSISCRSHTSISSRHPVITTIHGFSSDRIIPVYKRYDSTTAYVSISDSDRHPDLHYAATIHHGIDPDDFAIDPSPGEDLLFFGRVNLQSVGRPDAAAIAGHRSPASPSPPRGTTSSSSGTSHSLRRPEIGPALTSAKPANWPI